MVEAALGSVDEGAVAKPTTGYQYISKETIIDEGKLASYVSIVSGADEEVVGFKKRPARDDGRQDKLHIYIEHRSPEIVELLLLLQPHK